MKQWNISQYRKGELLSTDGICSAQCATGKSIQVTSHGAQTQGAPATHEKSGFPPTLPFLLCQINAVILLSHLLSKPVLLIQKRPCTVSPSLQLLSSTPSTEQAGT